MRFLIDLQCVQRRRPHDIDRYIFGLLDALLPLTQDAGHEVHLLLNASYWRTIPDLHRRYPLLCEQRRIHVFQGLTCSAPQAPQAPQDRNEIWRHAASCILRDFAIAATAPDAVLSPAFFDDGRSALTVGALTLSETPTIALHCSIIPKDIPGSTFEEHSCSAAPIETGLNTLFTSDVEITVSQAVRDSLLPHFSLKENQVPVIAGGVAPKFKNPNALSMHDIDALRIRYALKRHYILYTGLGCDLQGLRRLIQAYGQLQADLLGSYDLVIAGDLGQDERTMVQRCASEHAIDWDRIHLIGDVPDPELPILYALATLFVTPSLEDGFGLSALEAINCGTLALGANAGGLPEAIGTPEALFNPRDIEGLVALIDRSLRDNKFQKRLKAEQFDHARQFSWSRTAQALLDILVRSARLNTSSSDWQTVQKRLDDLEANAIASLRTLALPEGGLDAQDADGLARALVQTRLTCEATWRPSDLPETGLRWQIEGPFDSSYSLASVNRETALALKRRNISVALVSAEGDGPFDPDPAFMAQHPRLANMHKLGQKCTVESAHVLSRNMFPPRVADMRSPMNLLHGYAWEETGIPQQFTQDMTAHLQGLLVTSPHVRKIFIDAGIGLPVHVVGNGVDHINVPAEPLPEVLPHAKFTMLHVSSCFPRKGFDVLLKAVAVAFTLSDDVQLLIKTFPNPHNDVEAQIAALRRTFSDLPLITVIEEDLTQGQMRSLYEVADLLVCPSRAEGYCLPVAEAVLAGTPVLTTGWGGQRIFQGNPLVTFIDYSFTPAESHLGAWDSVWAEPDLDDLVAKLQQHYQAPRPASEIRTAAAQQILSEHSWDKVAERSEIAFREIAEAQPKPPPTVGWISSYNTRCGIATYSAHLIEAFPDKVTVFASQTQDRISEDGAEIRRCWRQGDLDNLSNLHEKIQTEDPRVLVIQFNYGFYSLHQLGKLILRAKAEERHVVLMLHATDDRSVPEDKHLASIRPALKACDQLLVHSHHDLNRLKALGLEDNVALFPHGVPYATVPPPPVMDATRPVVLGTYGFFLPPKGLNCLIEAVALLRGQDMSVSLEMVNAEFPTEDSTRVIAEAREQITRLGLEGAINLETRFLDDQDSFKRLSRADALVFPYQHTAESASGAIRQALALDRPVIATPLKIFDDVDPLITRLPGTSPKGIAEGLRPIVQALRNPSDAPETAQALRVTQHNAKQWRQSHAYQSLGPRLWRQICSLVE